MANSLPLILLAGAAFFLMSKGDEEEDAPTGNGNGTNGTNGTNGSGNGLDDLPEPGYDEFKEFAVRTGYTNMDPDNHPLSGIIQEFQLTQALSVQDGTFNQETYDELQKVLQNLSPQ
jgi:hypothetical protein